MRKALSCILWNCSLYAVVVLMCILGMEVEVWASLFCERVFTGYLLEEHLEYELMQFPL